MCNPKDKEGLSFWNIECFNTAMLAKQLWRLIDSPDTLFARVFRGRYFRNSYPLDPKRDYLPSYGWRSIISARSLVNKGLIKRIGKGDSIEAWNDPWIPAHTPRSASCRYPIYPNNFRVKDFIDNNSQTWNIPLLRATVVPEDVEIIQSIPISRFGCPDKLGWHFTKQGRYTVKSGYWVESREHSLDGIRPLYGPTIYTLQSRVWKIKCPPKIKHFLWQVLTGCLPVAQRLRGRGINCDSVCGRCGAEEESINHVLFSCPPAIQTWALSRIPSSPNIFPKASVYANMDYLLGQDLGDIDENFFPWIAWYIWKGRNDKVFKNLDRNPMETLILAEAEGKVWFNDQEYEKDHIISGEEPSLVEIPRDRWWCQTDGSWKVNDKFAGNGWVCSKNQEQEKMFGARNTLTSQSPLHTELEALIWAMECMKEFNRLDVVFATDCADVVKMVSSPKEWPAFEIHLEEFRRSKQDFEHFNISQIRRDENKVADQLAKSARNIPTAIVEVSALRPEWSINHL